MTKKRFKLLPDNNIEFLMQSKLLLPFYDDDKQLSLTNCYDLLNELFEKSEQLSKEILQLEEDLQYYKTKCACLEEGLFKQDREMSKLKEELHDLYELIY